MGSRSVSGARVRTLLWFAVALAVMAGAARAQSVASDRDLARIRHILIIYAENRSFDHLYGMFPGANGIANATGAQKTQLDHDGSKLPFLTVWKSGKPDERFPKLPNGPFRIDADPVNANLADILPSPIHAFYHNAEQINGGQNNMFAAMSNVGGWSMGYVDGSRFKLWRWAREFTLADNFFMGAFGGSFLNHQYLICACAPEFKTAPEEIVALLDSDGRMKKASESPSATIGPVKISGRTLVSPDHYAVNTIQPLYQPSGLVPAEGGDQALADLKGTEMRGPPLPLQTAKTIGDTLSAKGVNWVWYAGAWDEAVQDGPRPLDQRKVIYKGNGAPSFQPHHQPFNYFPRFAPGTSDRARHLRDGAELIAAIADGSLPPVAFYKPAGPYNQHPGYSDLISGDEHIAGVLEKLRANAKLWAETLVIVTYDENGGFWDHVPPPSGPGWGDRWGPGTRVPALIISPFARKGHIDNTSYDTGAILKLIARRFALEPLPGVRANTGDLTGALTFD
ncbi:MAG: acid phosphatase [Acetobacteraceae bacterium]|nr:acid phosphatase [Acetobacteraceae bacterium]